jgi:hypothetical protein
MTRLLFRPPGPPRRQLGEHQDWCAQGHQCGLGEHRADPVTLSAGPAGTVVLTRVLAANGHQHVEIRTRITLVDGEPQARAHLAHILTVLEALLRRVIRPRC